jgi:hypothetical protein
MEPVTLVAVAVFALFVLLRQGSWFSPALVAEEGPSEWAPTRPADEEEQLPETDRAPRFGWLGTSVACVLAVRVALLLTLHA